MTEVRVTCSCCGGSGFIVLTGEYRLTLERLRELGGERTGAELGRDMGIKATAANNRLAALERLGLATSRWYGRKRLYTVKETSQ